MFKGKILLITGGTGSFGNSVLKRYLNTEIDEIRIFSRDEKKQDDMRQFYNNDKIRYYIGDVRNRESVEMAMKNVDYVFHAAALKQVPSCEFFPIEAVKTNVLGCSNVIDSAVTCSVKKVIVLSTDKAVYPINAMGLTKALAEKIMIANSRNQNNEITLIGTRYGNVMASRGSVIPLFAEQIKNNQPLTITEPTMTRFLMSLDDAVELVLYAFDKGESGDIFVQKSPATTIQILAQAMLDLYDSKSKINIIGIRHGEKLFETLVNQEEMAKAKEEDKYFRIPADNRDLNYNKYFSEGKNEVISKTEYTSHNTRQLNLKETKELLLKLPLFRKDILGEDSNSYHNI